MLHSKSFKVQVVDEDREAVIGVRVDLMRASRTQEFVKPQYTDFNGLARFRGENIGEVYLFLNAVNYGILRYEAGRSVTVSYL